MNKGKSLWIRLGLGGTLMLVLLMAGASVLPFLIDLETVRGKVDICRIPASTPGLSAEECIRLNGFQLQQAAGLIPFSLLQYFETSTIAKALSFESRGLESFQVTIDNFVFDHEDDRIPFQLKARGRLTVEKNLLIMNDFEGSFGRSKFSGLTGFVTREEPRVLQIDSVSASLFLDELYPWLLSFEKFRDLFEETGSVEGVLHVEDLVLEGPLSKPAQWHFQFDGRVEDFLAESSLIPAPLSTPGGRVNADRKKLSFAGWEVHILDGVFPISGSIENYMEAPRRVEVRFDGDLGPRAARWLSDVLNVPPELKADSVVRMENVEIVWEEEIATLFSGKFSLADGPEIDIKDLLVTKESLSIRQAHILDQVSDVRLSFELRPKDIDLGFKGRLKARTVEEILRESRYFEGEIKGDFKAFIPLDRPALSTAHGKIEIEDFSIPGLPVRLDHAVLHAEGDRVEVESSSFLWAETKGGSAAGVIKFFEEAFHLDMDLEMNGLEWEDLEMLTATTGSGEEYRFDFPIRGEIRVRADYFNYAGFTWKPILARIAFREDGNEIRIEEADLCGIATEGNIYFAPHGIDLNFQFTADQQPLSDVLGCLWEKEDLMTGVLTLEGNVSSTDEEGALLESLRGNLEAGSEDGRIFRFGLLSRIFAVVNITEILRGRTPDLGKEGMAFDSIVARAAVEGGSVNLEEAVLEGPSMNIFCTGDLNFQENAIDLTVTVAPFRTVDAIIDRIPLIGDILGGELITLPVRVTGNLNDPTINPISPKAVGERMIGIMERTLTLPFRLIRPLFPEDREEAAE